MFTPLVNLLWGTSQHYTKGGGEGEREGGPGPWDETWARGLRFKQPRNSQDWKVSFHKTALHEGLPESW